MTASCLSTPRLRRRGAGSRLARPWGAGGGGRHSGAGRAPGATPAAAGAWPLAWSVAALLLAAALLAPEQPAAQAAICERHNGQAACRVW